MLEFNKIYNMDCINEIFIYLNNLYNNMGIYKGYKQSIEHKRNKSIALKIAHTKKQFGFNKGHSILGFKNKKHTNEFKELQSKRLKKNNPMKNRETALKVSRIRIEKGISAGKNNPNWRGGRTKYRGSNWHRQRKKSLERDNYICQICGKRQEELQNELTVHHIIPYYEKGTNDLSNLKTVCISCHFSIEPRRKKE